MKQPARLGAAADSSALVSARDLSINTRSAFSVSTGAQTKRQLFNLRKRPYKSWCKDSCATRAIDCDRKTSLLKQSISLLEEPLLMLLLIREPYLQT